MSPSHPRFLFLERIFPCCSKQEVRASELSTKTVSLVLFLFTALMLTRAAFIDYRSGAAETQSQFRTTQDKMAGQMLYLQARKMSGGEP